MKDNVAIASVVLTIIAIALLALIDPEPAARALDAVSTSWVAPWSAAEAAHLGSTAISGSRGGVAKPSPRRPQRQDLNERRAIAIERPQSL
jgi:hypothetical protein